MNAYWIIGMAIAIPVCIAIWLGMRSGDWEDFDDDEEWWK